MSALSLLTELCSLELKCFIILSNSLSFTFCSYWMPIGRKKQNKTSNEPPKPWKVPIVKLLHYLESTLKYDH